jgi:catechol 2,3-dioxygenase-like lactoylglutathione lyase family enzyme
LTTTPVLREAKGLATAGDVSFPSFWQVVLDTTDPRRLAEFYRQLLGYEYRPGDEPPAGDAKTWLVIRHPSGSPRVAFQRAEEVTESTWPDPRVPQQLHLDLKVPTKTELDAQHTRAVALGARVILDQADDEEEPLRVYADPSGHPFCIFVPGAL